MMKRIHHEARNIFTFDDDYYERKLSAAKADTAPTAKAEAPGLMPKPVMAALGAAVRFLSAQLGDLEEAPAPETGPVDLSNDLALPPLLDEGDDGGMGDAGGLQKSDRLETSLSILDALASALAPDETGRPNLLLRAFRE